MSNISKTIAVNDYVTVPPETVDRLRIVRPSDKWTPHPGRPRVRVIAVTGGIFGRPVIVAVVRPDSMWETEEMAILLASECEYDPATALGKLR